LTTSAASFSSWVWAAPEFVGQIGQDGPVLFELTGFDHVEIHFGGCADDGDFGVTGLLTEGPFQKC
jgi:hypothetical protein